MANATEVIAAVQSGNTEKLRNLLSENPALAASRDASGVSALMHAVYRRQTACIALLRQAGVPLDIFEAASLGALDSLNDLIAGDSSLVSTYSGDGFTALHFAAYFLQPEAGRFLLDHGANSAAVAKNPTLVMPLHSAVSSSNVEMTRDLLKRGAPVNARQQHGWTPLHAAAQNGNLEIVEILLQNGADPWLKNDDSVTAFDVANKHDRNEVAQRLAIAQSV
jgi:ankyrin repeat protein